MAEELQNLKLLIKFLGMTRSSNDAEALVAMRKANEHLDKFKATWEELLSNKVKITIVEDPFKNLQEPKVDDRAADYGYRPARRPTPTPQKPRQDPYGDPYTYQPTPRSTPQRPQPKPAAASPAYDPFAARPTPRGATAATPVVNKYPGVCHKCGTRVDAGMGLATKAIGGRWVVECLAGKCITSKSAKSRINLDDMDAMTGGQTP
jgi:hypothetical protein